MSRARLAISSSFLRDLASKPSRLDDQVIFVTQPFPRDCRLIKVQVSSISAKLLCFYCGLIMKRVKQVLTLNPTAGEAAQYSGEEAPCKAHPVSVSKGSNKATPADDIVSTQNDVGKLNKPSRADAANQGPSFSHTVMSA